MSWCRLSTVLEDKKLSDLYIYDSDYGVEVIIAKCRIKNIENAPQLPPFSEHNVDEYLIAHYKRIHWLDENKEFVQIKLPYAGEHFTFVDKEDLIEFLIELKNLGYNFPEYVFEYAEEYENE